MKTPISKWRSPKNFFLGNQNKHCQTANECIIMADESYVVEEWILKYITEVTLQGHGLTPFWNKIKF